MRVDFEKRYLPDIAYPEEIAYFFSSWVCKNKDGQWWIHSDRPYIDKTSGKWLSPDPFDDLDIPKDHIKEPDTKWDEYIWAPNNRYRVYTPEHFEKFLEDVKNIEYYDELNTMIKENVMKDEISFILLSKDYSGRNFNIEIVLREEEDSFNE